MASTSSTAGEAMSSTACVDPLDVPNIKPLTVSEDTSSTAGKREESSIACIEPYVLSNLKSLTISEDTHDAPDKHEESNRPEVLSNDNAYASAVKFEDLNLSKNLIDGLYVKMRFSRPSQIQATTLPMIINPPYKNLVAQSPNGSGKTTCFVLGMLSRVDPSRKIPQALCVCHTRELALQNCEVLRKMGAYTGITVVCAIPAAAADYIPISRMPSVTDHVVIGTPGTIQKWLSHKKLTIGEMKILVFDEADKMLAEDGFKIDSQRIMKDIRSSGGCQVLLFSATFDEAVKDFVSKEIRDANEIYMKAEDLKLNKVKQYKVFCPDQHAKIEVIKTKILEFGEKVGWTIIFVRTRNCARMLHQSLKDEGYQCTSIHGDLKHNERDKVIKEFKDGYTKVLIATDILARGFDLEQVNLVINFDLPKNHDDPQKPNCDEYMHRIGRAGRFGRKGAAFNLMSSDEDRTIIADIERHFQHQITELANWKSEDEFEGALKDAGLL